MLCIRVCLESIVSTAAVHQEHPACHGVKSAGVRLYTVRWCPRNRSRSGGLELWNHDCDESHVDLANPGPKAVKTNGSDMVPSMHCRMWRSRGVGQRPSALIWTAIRLCSELHRE